MYARQAVTALVTLFLASTAKAQLVNLGPGSFTPIATAITFSEPGYALGTVNPSYSFSGLPGLGNVTVSFAGAFVGQTVTGGGVRTLTGNPTGPLSLNTAERTFITGDAANPTSPVLSGTPLFNGPIVMLFSQPVAAVGLSGGFFDAIGGTSISAYGATGNLLGSLVNSQLGVEFYGLADATGANTISGLSFYITGPEPAGFAIDNVTFGSRAVVVIPGIVPEPTTVVMMTTGLIAVAAAAYRRRSREV